MKKERLRKKIMEKNNQLAYISFFSIAVSLVFCSTAILILRQNPLTVFRSLLEGSGILQKSNYSASTGQLSNFLNFVDQWAPMLLASLSIVAGMKAGLFNIGVSGQMLAAGYTATTLVGYLELPGIIVKPLAVFIGMAAGCLVGALIGYLKVRFNVHEVVSAIMLNHTARYIISFLITNYNVDAMTRQSRKIRESAMLTIHGISFGNQKIDLPIGILIAFASALLLQYVLRRTTVGFEIKMVGLSRMSAEYAGVNVRKTETAVMAVSGMLAGLAGVVYYMGYFGSIQPKVLSNLGFDAFTVTLVGNSSPIGVIFSSFFINIFDKGSTYMNSVTGFEPEICDVLVSIILLFSACTPYIQKIKEGNK